MKQRSSLLILCSVLIVFFVASVSAQTCVHNGKNFIPNGTYDANRRLILSSLPSNAAAQDGFYSGSIGQEPSRVYAAGMCIPGADANDCSACIKSASDWLVQDCTNQTDAYYWALDPTLCLVRYSNNSFTGSAGYWEIVPQYLVMNTANINSNLTEFKKIWERLIHSIIAAASAPKSRYKADVAALTPFQNIYALMQCTPDVSSGDCDNCLRQSVIDYQSCCGEKTGGYVMRPICFFRWQLFTFSKAFGNITLAPPSPHPSPPPLLQRQPSSASDQAKKTDTGSRNISLRTIIAIVVTVIVFIIIIIIIIVVVFARRSTRGGKSDQQVKFNQTGMTTVRSLQFDFKTIEVATNNFSERNKIGRGGFGDVFKGTLMPGGREVAVKRLSRTSEQGEKEFKNEVIVIAKLQHGNLVRLLGYSVKGEERVLVYEFVPNKSLDSFLSDPLKQAQLSWTKRFNIIKGIARGILYLHQDSRPKIIHRDLKADNILLEADMNPKISDFGTARIFGIGQTSSITERIFGTEGYMPPEYRCEGQFSVKTDVYSFGVLVLEIICGKKNRSFCFPGPDLVTYAWRLWREETPLELVDQTILENFPAEEVTRCIHIALLCVQHEPTDRPHVSTIVSMLTSTTIISHVPQTPGSLDSLY
ncbi:cysteine-rich receptor-like protein kinase 13 isoform X1 [Brassica napus]|uniref:cysteine-rich receptor-like protein kinase 13 isoform X1 n=1 Tax=Brassica napus TaxID=3708 RepID=UPI002078586D|nr:cysteine-rich receptor-like protein kinase 13 isoform X1 [Brassica napus]